VALDTHIQFWQAEVIDNILLQQDAFDLVDSRTPQERQKFMVDHILEMLNTDFSFEGFDEVRPFFKKVINIYKQMNYKFFKNEEFEQFRSQLEQLVNEKSNPITKIQL
jgi:V/A-type H+-transporting ATPase subunit A